MNESSASSPKQKTSRGVARKVLILGLDGATWDVLDPLMDAGLMPNFQRLLRGGTRGVLRSTIPPITPAAWTTFMTGRSPGAHGIFDFERYDVRTNKLSFNTTNVLGHVRTIWQILGSRGYQVGSIAVPMTYPPVPVNGFLISGFGAVSTKTDFTYPADLRHELLKRWPDFTFKNTWKSRGWRPDQTVADNIAQVTRSFHQGAEVLRYCGDRYGWDVLMIVYKLVDNLQHKAWRYLDPRTRDRWPKRRKLTEQCFAELDVAIGDILAYAKAHDAHVFVMSDHGHGSLEGKAQPNLMLKDWGYLKLRSETAQAGTTFRHKVSRLFRKKGKFAAGNFSLEDDLAVDFAQTRAAVMHAGMAGFLYLNLRGRQETGIVEPADYERLRDELKARFEAATCSDRDGRTIKVFEAVYKPEELYRATREGQPWMPDLLLCPTPRLAVVRKIRGDQHVQWVPLPRMEGTHRREGIFAVAGPGVRVGARVDTDIINSTPTILAMLGESIPSDMEGAVIADAFDPPLTARVEEALDEPVAVGAPSGGEVYSAEDVAALTRRLADLGYLE
jgi:predicted AlkP superfamily phosphohydrolase/phosphomutase